MACGTRRWLHARLDRPQSDGFLDAASYFYQVAPDLPEGIQAEKNGEWTAVLERFSDSVQGRQQFACDGGFAMDRLIAEKVPCLGIL